MDLMQQAPNQSVLPGGAFNPNPLWPGGYFEVMEEVGIPEKQHGFSRIGCGKCSIAIPKSRGTRRVQKLLRQLSGKDRKNNRHEVEVPDARAPNHNSKGRLV
jgi:hypothetical protein